MTNHRRKGTRKNVFMPLVWICATLSIVSFGVGLLPPIQTGMFVLTGVCISLGIMFYVAGEPIDYD